MIFLLSIFLARTISGAALKFFVMLSVGLLIVALIAFFLFLAFHKKPHWLIRSLFVLWTGLLSLQLFCVCTFLESAPKVFTLDPIGSYDDVNGSLSSFCLPQNQAVLVNTFPVSPYSGRGTVSFSDISSASSNAFLPFMDERFAYLFVKNCDSITVNYSVWDAVNEWELHLSGFHRTYNISVSRNNEKKDNLFYIFQLEPANVSMTEYAHHYFNFLGLWIETQ